MGRPDYSNVPALVLFYAHDPAAKEAHDEETLGLLQSIARGYLHLYEESRGTSPQLPEILASLDGIISIDEDVSQGLQQAETLWNQL